MVKNSELFRHQKAYLLRRFTSKEGIFEYFIGAFFWGFFIINYAHPLYAWLSVKIASFGVQGGAIQYVAYLVFGIVTSVLGLVSAFVVLSIYHAFIKKLIGD